MSTRSVFLPTISHALVYASKSHSSTSPLRRSVHHIAEDEASRPCTTGRPEQRDSSDQLQHLQAKVSSRLWRMVQHRLHDTAATKRLLPLACNAQAGSSNDGHQEIPNDTGELGGSMTAHVQTPLEDMSNFEMWNTNHLLTDEGDRDFLEGQDELWDGRPATCWPHDNDKATTHGNAHSYIVQEHAGRVQTASNETFSEIIGDDEMDDMWQLQDIQVLDMEKT